MNNVRSERVTIETDKGAFTGFLAQPSAGDGTPRVLLFNAWWGLAPSFIDLATRLAAEGLTVFAPDLYDGKIAATIEDAQAMLEARDLQRHEFIATAAVDWMLAQPGAPRGGLGLVGFSMGGSWSIYLAGEYPQAVKVVVLVYAVGEGDFGKMQARIQGHFAGQDEWTTQEEMDYVEGKLRENEIPYQFFTYPEAQHWFAEADRPEYRAADAELLLERAVRFLKETLTAAH